MLECCRDAWGCASKQTHVFLIARTYIIMSERNGVAQGQVPEDLFLESWKDLATNCAKHSDGFRGLSKSATKFGVSLEPTTCGMTMAAG